MASNCHWQATESNAENPKQRVGKKQKIKK
jgi:hypothetical protein